MNVKTRSHLLLLPISQPYTTDPLLREIRSIYCSQGGIQTSNDCWNAYCLEHGIQSDVTMPSYLTIGTGNDSLFPTLFTETGTGNTHTACSMCRL